MPTVSFIFSPKIVQLEIELDRAEARKIFAALIGEPVFDKAMQKYLPVSVLRSIQRTVDALRAQHAVRIQMIHFCH